MFRSATISLLVAASSAATFGQDPLSYSIATPRPINPAAGSTNPSALATQSLNPYLGSVPGGKLIPGEIKLSLHEAIQRGLEFNLGLVESKQADAAVQAQRARAFSALLPQISARAEQNFEQRSVDSIGLRVPPQAGFRLPPTTGAFGYSEGRISLRYSAFDPALIASYKARRAAESASALSTRDSRDVVVLAVGTAYFQVVSSEARLATARAALVSARRFQAQVAHQFEAEVSPEIDLIRATVELSAAKQRVTDAENDLEKDKLTLDRIDELQPDNSVKTKRKFHTIGPSRGDDALTKRQAEHQRDRILAGLDAPATRTQAVVAAKQPVDLGMIIFGKLAELWRKRLRRKSNGEAGGADA